MTEELFPRYTTEGDVPAAVADPDAEPATVREWATADEAMRLLVLATGESQLCIDTEDGPICFRPEDAIEPEVLAGRLRLTPVGPPVETVAVPSEEAPVGEAPVGEQVPQSEEPGAGSPHLEG